MMIPGILAQRRRSGAVDPFWSSVVLAMHLDGANGSASFVDQKGKTITRGGNVVISTAQSVFGGASAYFDGVGDYLEVPASSDFAFGTGDFTVELWVRPDNLTTFVDLFSTGSYETGQFTVRLTNTGRVQCYHDNALSGIGLLTSVNQVSASTFSHVAVSRAAGVTRIFINGALEVSSAGSYDVNSVGGVRIGKQLGDSSLDVKGFIDDLRITKLVGRYITPFTLPTMPFPNS